MVSEPSAAKPFSLCIFHLLSISFLILARFHSYLTDILHMCMAMSQ